MSLIFSDIIILQRFFVQPAEKEYRNMYNNIGNYIQFDPKREMMYI